MELERELARTMAQARYHEKNKHRLNKARMARARTPKGTYTRAKRRAERRGQDWSISYEDWWRKWEEADWVWNDRKGFKVPAWEMRGGDYNRNTQFVRIDPEGGWTNENTRIQIPVYLQRS